MSEFKDIRDDETLYPTFCEKCGIRAELHSKEGLKNCDGSRRNAIFVNDKQIGGMHYKDVEIQHWDFAAANDLDYFQGQITKYVTRWKKKNGVQDLLKAQHFLEKYISLQVPRGPKSGKP